MPKRTWNPKKRRRVKKHGFRKKMKSLDGRNTIKRRRSKGRSKLAPALSTSKPKRKR